MIDFTAIERPSSPNTYLIGPEDLLGSVERDGEAASFPYSAAEVFAATEKVIRGFGNASEIRVDSETMQIRYTAKVGITPFKDDIDLKVMAAADGSIVAIYSRSRKGYSDFGVNKGRVRMLIEKIGEAL